MTGIEYSIITKIIIRNQMLFFSAARTSRSQCIPFFLSLCRIFYDGILYSISGQGKLQTCLKYTGRQPGCFVFLALEKTLFLPRIDPLLPFLPQRGLMALCDRIILFITGNRKKTFLGDYLNAGAAKAAGAQECAEKPKRASINDFSRASFSDRSAIFL